MRKKIRNDFESDNNEIQKMNSKKTNFYGEKINQLNNLKQKVADAGPQK